MSSNTKSVPTIAEHLNMHTDTVYDWLIKFTNYVKKVIDVDLFMQGLKQKLNIIQTIPIDKGATAFITIIS